MGDRSANAIPSRRRTRTLLRTRCPRTANIDAGLPFCEGVCDRGHVRTRISSGTCSGQAGPTDQLTYARVPPEVPSPPEYAPT